MARTKSAAAPRSSGAASLSAYRSRRDFARTGEPRGETGSDAGSRFVVQRHAARRLHFDLRLEMDGVLRSWAVTRGPSLVAGDKRLAVHTEDHPLDYLAFEGVIPAGEYGGGSMIVWDRGTWTPEGDAAAGYAKGHLEFTLSGERLGGRWHLVRMRRRAREKADPWLLIKADDAFARPAGAAEIADEARTSLVSGITNEELLARGEVRADHAARAATRRPAGRAAARPAAARKALLPVFVEPALATLAAEAPEGDDWLHEIKFDGYRLQARLDGGRVRLSTRNGLDWTERFPAVAEALCALGAGAALLDGEVVVETGGGLSSFALLQADLADGRGDRMVYHAFDLLHLDGDDLRSAPLKERKTLLAALLDDVPAGGVLRYSDHVEGNGRAMARNACRMGLEGIVAKRSGAPYRSGRTGAWLKVKCVETEDFVVAGYVPSTTGRKAVGSLVLAQVRDGALVHAGRVGSGFSEAAARELHALLEPDRRPAPPFAERPSTAASRGVRWVEPRHVAEVELRGRTADGLVRHASFKGLREDKAPGEAVAEGGAGGGKGGTAAPAGGLTHPDRVLWPDVGVTKQGLADYHAEVAAVLLPHVAGRPLALVRCPGGIGGDCFFQKHAFAGMREGISRARVDGEEVLHVADEAGLLALVQAGAIELHPWGARLDDPERPDRLVFDLDPAEDLPFAAVVDAAHDVRARLEAQGLVSFVKTTGGKGLHVVVPLRPRATWADAKAFCHALAGAMARDEPERYTDVLSKEARTGRIFVDYLRNARGATAVAAYSPRARPQASVATPLSWDEATPALGPAHFTVASVPGRLAALGADPWADMDRVDQALPGAIRTGRAAVSPRRRRKRDGA